MAWLRGLRGALVDVDGTLLVADRAVAGAAECLDRLRAAGIAVRVTTNTTRRPIADVAAILNEQGISVSPAEILAPSVLARAHMLDSGRRRAALLVPDGALEDFEGVESVEKDPDWVVLGDLGEALTVELLNRAFAWIRGRATLLALHKNRYWIAGARGPRLDAGPFVAALEFATETRAEVLGKPSAGFFNQALAMIGRSAGQTLVVGDDVTTDVRGGAGAGCSTALVRTGKFDARALAAEKEKPDLVIDSIADLYPGRDA